jgi:hypothetical protein
VDWDWPLIIEIAILVLAITGTTLIWAERTERRRDLGLPVVPHPQWRALAAGSGRTLRIEAANTGAAASRCCVVMQADKSLYAGTFSLSEQQSWSSHTLELFDVLDDGAGATLAAVRHSQSRGDMVDACSEQVHRSHQGADRSVLDR